MADPTRTAEIAPPARATTPASIFVALAMFAFAVATPFLGEADSRDAKGDGGWAILRVMLGWMLAGGIAVVVGIICTIIGAVRSPRSAWTRFAIFLACCAGFGVLYFIAAASR